MYMVKGELRCVSTRFFSSLYKSLGYVCQPQQGAEGRKRERGLAPDTVKYYYSRSYNSPDCLL